jgi:ribonuclease D
VKPPTTSAELRKIQGMSAGLADRRGAQILAAVRRGADLPEAELPRFPQTKRPERDPVVEARADRLRAVRDGVAASLNLDPGFLISRAVLDEVARQNPASPEALAAIPGMRRWQMEALGGEILRTLCAETT